MNKLTCILLTLLLALACSRTPKSTVMGNPGARNQERWLNAPTVILVSIDGLRYDYLDHYHPPVLSRLRAEGASVHGLTPIFPSKTFPNHMSLITGVKAQKHGIVGNEFYEPSSRRTYAMKDRQAVEDGYWYQSPPVWNILGQQGMVTASYFWVGSEAPIAGRQPDYWFRYEGKVPGDERVDQVLKWLNMEHAARPHFITLYFSQVDNAGHEYGPVSEEVKQALYQVDGHLDRLMKGLAKLAFPVHVVVVSDHGMGALDKARVDFVDEWWQADEKDKVVGQGATVSIHLNDRDPKNIERVAAALNKNKEWRAWPRTQFPAQWGLDHERIGDILLVAKPGRYIYAHKKIFKLPFQGGSHGWEPDKMPDMDGVFIAHGPQVLAKKRLGRVANIHVAPFLLGLFGVELPLHLDGRWSELGAKVWRRP